MKGSRVGIVGGSIAGCGAAIALHRLGCDVTVFERSSGALKDRGSGIAVPNALRDELRSAGYLPADYPTFQANARRFYVDDRTDGGSLRWVQPGPMSTNNWGVLWRGLRSMLPAEVDYRDGAAVAGVRQTAAGVELELDGGESVEVDVAIGADGYRSTLRTLLHPTSAPEYAGYILWRGNFAADRLRDTAAWDEVIQTGEWLTVGFDGGHGVMYPIPNFGTDPSRYRVNWAIYAPMPEGLEVKEPSSIPPGQVAPEVFAQYERLVAERFPPRLRPVFTSPIEEVSIQPIYDEVVDSYVGDRIALIGDAATLSRPHTGSGATKALQECRLIESLGDEHDRWEPLLAAYDADRTPAGRDLVELGRRIGRDQVERTPPMLEMSPEDFEAWARGTLAGDTLYFWADSGSEASG